MQSSSIHGLEDLIEDVDDQAESKDQLSVGDLLDAFGTRSFGPLLAIPALIALSPVGMIPGVPAVLGCVVILVAAQHLVGFRHPWVPKRLKEMSVDSGRWEDAQDRVKPYAKRVDRFVQPRLTWIMTGLAERVISVVAILLALMMVPLELVPFAVAVPAFALLMLGLAVSVRDGVLALIGLVVTLLSGYLIWATVL